MIAVNSTEAAGVGTLAFITMVIVAFTVGMLCYRIGVRDGNEDGRAWHELPPPVRAIDTLEEFPPRPAGRQPPVPTFTPAAFTRTPLPWQRPTGPRHAVPTPAQNFADQVIASITARTNDYIDRIRDRFLAATVTVFPPGEG